MPGTIRLRISAKILSRGSPSSGACFGSAPIIAPGLAFGATGNVSIFSRYSAIQSASSCNCLRNSSGGTSPRGCRSFIQNQTLASRLSAVPSVRVNKCSKSKAETEMECAGVFIGPRVGIDAVIETDRADGQFITQPYAYRIAHVVETWFFRCWKQIARVREQRAL